MDGVELCAQLSTMEPQCETRVLVLSAFGDRELVSKAIQAGAVGYLDKHEPRHDICEAIVRVGRGGTAFSGNLREGLIDGLHQMYGH